MCKPENIYEASFARLVLGASPAARGEAEARLRERMSPARPYHNAAHIEAVLDRVYVWTGGEPPAALVAAALYHDAIYDPTRHDNEAESAALCLLELASLGVPGSIAERAAALIAVTARHEPDGADADALALCDADLWILGSDPTMYSAYVAAIRAEYAHVSEDAWRTGRARVLEHFLERERIYHGGFYGADAREAQARANLANEVASLKPDGTRE